ncbi:unnamed protein product [Rotaria magnacalcarata]
MQGDSYHLRQSVDTQNKTFSPYSSSIETSSNEQMHNSSRPTFTPPNQRKSDASENAAKMIPIDIDMNLKENMEEHSTIYYDIQGLVLRRGQPFSFTITFNQDFPADKYNLSFIFKPQTWPNFPRVKIPLNGSSNGWSAERLSTKDQENNCVYFQICSPCDATIGKYSFFLEISPLKKDLATKQDLSIFQFDIDIYILFNPWNSTDVCGLLSSDQIAEYALSEHGQIYLGSCEVPRSIPWYFGQFERDVLLTALTLLNKTSLPTGSHIDISLILRRLSSKICSDPGENDGIFPPSSDEPLSLRQENGYTSSPAILKKYLLLNGQSVQGDSGSNWQHAAVFCSLCRSLGIPSRIVTVYNATCGAQEQEKINLYGDKRQQPIIVVNKKVTRPWYLWNECWMRRDDVPAQNSGWQVVDSSAIDYNTKMRRIGPCSVAALKSGSLALKWDTPEIYSVLNANRSYWLVYPDGSKKLIDMEDNVTDTKVLTKSLSKENVYDDITSNYKLKKSTSNETPYQIFPYHDVNIDIDIPNSLRLGDNLQVVLNATNQSNKPRTLALALRLIRLNPTIEIKPNSNKQTQDQYASQDSNPGIINTNSQAPIQSIVQAVRLDMNEYKSIPMKVADHHQLWTGCFDSLLKLYINAIVKETGQIYQKEKYIINEHDDIMQVSLENDVIEAGQPAKLQIHLNNSSSSSLNNAIITIDGFGISKPIPITEPLQSNTSTTIPVEFIPSRIGLSRLEVTLTSDSIRVPPKSVVLEVKQSISLNDQKQYEQLTSPNIDDEITSQPPREKNDRVQTEDLNATQPTFIPQTKTEATPHVASVPLPKSKSDNDVKSPLPPVSTDTAPVAEVKPKAPTASSSPKPAHEISAEAPLPAACGSVPETKPTDEAQAEAPTASTETEPTDEVTIEALAASIETILADEVKPEEPLPEACVPLRATQPTDEIKAEPSSASTETKPGDGVNSESPLSLPCVVAEETKPAEEVQPEASVLATYVLVPSDIQFADEFKLEAQPASSEPKPADEVEAQASLLEACVLVPATQPADEIKPHAQTASIDIKPADEEEANAPVLDAYVLAPATQPADEIRPEAPLLFPSVQVGEKNFPDEIKAPAPLLLPCAPLPETNTTEALKYEPLGGSIEPMVPDEGEQNSLPVMIVTESPHEITQEKAHLVPSVLVPKIQLTEQIRRPGAAASTETKVPAGTETEAPGLEAYVLVPGIQLATEIKLEAPTASSENHPTGQLNPEAPVLEASVPVPAIQLPDHLEVAATVIDTSVPVPAIQLTDEIKAEGTCVEPCVPVPGITLADETKAESVAVSSDRKPTDVVNPETPVLEARVPPVTIQLPDEIKAEGSLLQPGVPVPGITLADETKAASVAVSSDSKQTDVVNPETPALEARVPPVTIQLPDEIKAEGSLLQPGVPVPGITLADETKAESVAVSSDSKQTDVVNPETPALEARVPPVTIQLPDEIKAEGSLLQPGVPVPGITLPDETKAASVAVLSDSKQTDVVNPETPVLEARVPPVTIQLPDEIKAEGSLLQPGLPVPGITLAHETKAEGTVVEPSVPVPGITLVDETTAESVAVCSKTKPTDVVNPETSVPEAFVPFVTTQLPDEIEAEGTVLQACVLVPGITLVDEPRAESAAVCSKAKPTDVVNPETSVPEACVPVTTTQLPDEIKAEGTVLQACVLVPGITVVDETRAECAAVSSERKPTDVVNPETSFPERCVPAVTIPLPDNIKAEGTVLQACVLVPGITLVDETRAESAAVSSERKPTDVVKPERSVPEACVPVVTTQPPDEIEAEGTVQQACVLVPGITLVDETRAESVAVCSKTKPTDVVNPETSVPEACVPVVTTQLPDEIKAEGAVLQACVLVPGITLVDETRAESAAVCSKTKPTDVVNPETPVLEACVPGVDIQLPDEIKAEGTVLQACVLVPGITLVDETRAESAAVSSERKATDVVKPETSVPEACVPVVTTQLPDEIKAEGTVQQACAIVPGVTLVDETTAESAAVCSKTKPTDVVNPETPVLEACVPGVDIQLPDEIKAEGTVLQACVLVPGVTLVDETRAESAAVCSKTKPTDVVNPETPVLEACVPGVDIQLPDEIKAEGTVLQACVLVPGITLVDETRAESAAVSSERKPTASVKPETSVPEACLPVVTTQPPDEIEAEGTVQQACVLVPGITLVDETRAESAAVSSERKPTDAVKPETSVPEACLPVVTTQLPDEIKAEGTVQQACVLVPGITLVDETRAESAAVCSKTKPTDVVNPETPVLEACVPGVDIQLPDEIKAEGTVLQACVLVPGIPLVDETKAESVAVSSEAKPTAVVTPETLVLEACVPVFTIQLPDGIKAEGAVFEACVPASAIRHTDEINAEALRASSKTRAFYDIKARTCTALNETKLADDVAVEAPALEACLVAVESRLAEEGRGEGQVASTETKPAYEVQGKARSLVSCVLVGETKPPDVVKAEAPAGSIVTFFADGVEAESRASCALTIPADEFKREASVHGGSVGLPHVEAYEEVKAEKALVGVIRTMELVDQSGTKICCEKLDDTENLPSGEDNFVTPDTLSETGNELESDLAISDLSTSCDVVVEDNSDAFEFESDGQVVGSANCDELGVVSLVPLVLRSERKLDVIDNVELLRILIVMTELLGIPVCADSSRKGVSCGEPATQGINASNISNAGRSNVPGCQEIPEGMIENLSKEVVTQEKVVEPDVRSGASVSDASKERVTEVALRSGSMLSPRILITEVEPFDCNESTLPEHLDAVNEVLTSDIEQLETDIVMNDGNSSSGDVTIISNHANVTNNAEDSSHTHSISGVPNTEFLPALGTLDDLRKLERFKTMRSAAVQVVGDSTVVADKMDSGDAADINKLVTTSSNESNSKNETVSAVVDVAETPEGFVAKALAFFQRKQDGEKEPAEDDKQADVGDSEEEKFTLIEPVISNTVPPSGSEEEKKENDNLTNAATSRKIHEKVVDHVARVDVGSVIENINPAAIESKITLQGLSATIVDRKNIGDSKPIVVSPVQSQIECSGLVGNVEVTKQINDVKLESGFAVGSNEISSKGAAMGDNAQKFIDTKIEKITEAKMTEIENYYSTDTLIIFVIRNSFARIMMASLLVVCYARTMCEKQQLWILPKFCYIGLVFLILDWWIILLKVNIHRKLVEYFWINSGVAIFIIFTMPPLWISRYGYFIQSVKNLKVQAKHANINLESYVSECWDLKERKELDFIEFRRTESLEQALSTINKNISECNQKDEMNAGSWCSYGICLMKQMPDEMLEQVVVLSTICVRWMITGNLGLDQLITYFISTASDIVDFASTMVGQSEELIQDKNKDIMKAIIAAYFISLSQFSVNLSGKRKHNHAYDLILWSKAKIRERLLIIIDLLCSTEIWGILAQMATEDGLLLGLRILTIIKFNASTLENFFFAVKNSLTIAIFTYYAAAISDSYIRHRYFYQHYFRKQSQQNDQKLVSKRLIKRKSILKGSQSVKNESINLI